MIGWHIALDVRFLRRTAYYVVTRLPCLHSRSETRAGKQRREPLRVSYYYLLRDAITRQVSKDVKREYFLPILIWLIISLIVRENNILY